MEMNSPLEELSQAYKCDSPHSLADSWEKKIFDDVENQILYIVPAGFTQRDAEGRNRKTYYKSIYQKAINFNVEKKLNPFGLTSHSVMLRPEPQNQYDKNAIKIGIRFDDYSKTPQWFKPQVWQDIGYVPKAISMVLKKNFKMLRNGTILSVHALFDQDVYYARIAFPYGKEMDPVLFTDCNTARYDAILKE
jgi:hypothetical protein